MMAAGGASGGDVEVQETEVQTDRVLTVPNALSMLRLLGVPERKRRPAPFVVAHNPPRPRGLFSAAIDDGPFDDAGGCLGLCEKGK